MEIDVERKFRLSGEPFDLEALIELFPEIVLKKETVHYLQLSSCDEMPDQEALQHASDELARMNGIVALDHGNHRRIKIDGITHIDPETGEFTTALLPECRIEGRALTRAKVVLRLMKDGVEIAQTPGPTFGEKAQKIANKSEPFSKALRLLGEEGDTFPGLYKVWECIKKGNGGQNEIVRKGWDSRGERRRFTGSAQDERHVEKASAETTAPKMTLPEARAFISKLLTAWGTELGL